MHALGVVIDVVRSNFFAHTTIFVADATLDLSSAEELRCRLHRSKSKLFELCAFLSDLQSLNFQEATVQVTPHTNKPALGYYRAQKSIFVSQHLVDLSSKDEPEMKVNFVPSRKSIPNRCTLVHYIHIHAYVNRIFAFPAH